MRARCKLADALHLDNFACPPARRTRSRERLRDGRAVRLHMGQTGGSETLHSHRGRAGEARRKASGIAPQRDEYLHSGCDRALVEQEDKCSSGRNRRSARSESSSVSCFRGISLFVAPRRPPEDENLQRPSRARLGWWLWPRCRSRKYASEKTEEWSCARGG
jgi:hypothetical protein